MGELKPCPFCGGEATFRDHSTCEADVACMNCCASLKVTTAGNWEVTHDTAITAWNTRPRTEGRGDQEPVAWQEAAEPFFRLAREVINPVNGERPWHADSKDWMVVFSFAGQSVTLGDLRRAAVASPIREPEISRTMSRDEAREFVRSVAMSLPPSDFGSTRAINAMADAILNLAPVGGREEGSARVTDSGRGTLPTPPDGLDPKNWEVEVRIDGESVLTIGHSHLSGIEDIDRYGDTVRTCAEHLRSFIGNGDPVPCFGCGGSGQERWMGPVGEEVGPCSVCQPEGPFICPICGGNDDDRQLMCEACGGSGWLGEHYDPSIDDLSGAQRSEDDHGEE